MTRWTRDRSFRPGLAPTLAVAVLFPLLLGLGFWQLDRAAQKREIAVDFAAGERIAASPTAAAFATLPRYQRVSLRGRFDGTRQFLLDNMTDGGAAGYQVLTPFRPEGWDRWVMVNRGWLRKDFTDPRPPDIGVDGELREIRGRVSPLPRPGLELEEAEPADSNWPRVVQFPRMASLSGTLGQSFAARSLLLDADAADGFLRRWEPVSMGPEQHIGYAVQWFALAATLLVIYFVVNWKRIEHDRTEDGA